MNPVAKATGENVVEPSSWQEGLSEFYELIRYKAFGLLSVPTRAGVSKSFEDFVGEARNFDYAMIIFGLKQTSLPARSRLI